MYVCMYILIQCKLCMYIVINTTEHTCTIVNPMLSSKVYRQSTDYFLNNHVYCPYTTV